MLSQVEVIYLSLIKIIKQSHAVIQQPFSPSLFRHYKCDHEFSVKLNFPIFLCIEGPEQGERERAARLSRLLRNRARNKLTTRVLHSHWYGAKATLYVFPTVKSVES